MTARVQKVEPAVIQSPLTLLPIAIGADLIGRLVGSAKLRATGRYLTPLVVGAAVAAAVRVRKAPRRAESALHRELSAEVSGINVPAVVAMTAVAAWRWRRETPGPAYLALGAIGFLSHVAFASSTAHTRDDGPSIGGMQAPPVVRRHRSAVAAAVRTAAGDMLRGL
jgi:uncharacterized membrane protein